MRRRAQVLEKMEAICPLGGLGEPILGMAVKEFHWQREDLRTMKWGNSTTSGLDYCVVQYSMILYDRKRHAMLDAFGPATSFHDHRQGC